MLRYRLLFVVLAFVLVSGTVPAAFAQGDESDDGGLRLVCLIGFGCAYTPLTDEDIEIVFPDTTFFVFEDLYDGPPAGGVYNFTYPGAGLNCNGVDFSTQPEDSAGSFEVLDADDEQILASGLASESAVLDNYGAGMYAGTLTLSDGGGIANYSLFVMVTSETTVTGLVMGELTSPDGTCSVWVYYRGEQAE